MSSDSSRNGSKHLVFDCQVADDVSVLDHLERWHETFTLIHESGASIGELWYSISVVATLRIENYVP